LFFLIKLNFPGKTLSAICIALLLHRSAAVQDLQHRILQSTDPNQFKPKPSSGIFLVICPKACIYDAWLRCLERFTALGHKVLHYEGSKREEKLKHEVEKIWHCDVNELVKGKGTRYFKENRLLFIITTSQTASGECIPNRKMKKIKMAKSRAGTSALGNVTATASGAQNRVAGVYNSLLFKLPYTLVIFDEVWFNKPIKIYCQY
jgi:hypothetical protein